MKKTALSIIMLATVLFIFGCTGNDTVANASIPFADAPAELMIYADSYEDLLEASDYLVIAERLPKTENVEILRDEESNIPLYGVTKTEVRINQVLYGDNQLEKDMIVSVWENYFLTENYYGEEYYSTIEGYRPLVTGDKYLLFLKKEKGKFKGGYAITGVFQGKYPLSLITEENLDTNKLDGDSLQLGVDSEISNKDSYIKLLMDVRKNRDRIFK